jgi:hypothetical protein
MGTEEIRAFGEKLADEVSGVLIFVLSEDGLIEGHFFNVTSEQIRQACCLGIHRSCVRDATDTEQSDESASKVM